MRTARLMWGVSLLLAGASAGHAESTPYEAVVTALQIEVRSGPSNDPKYYPTGRLRQGDKVQVQREEDGWLAITPPYGSFSWINDRFLELKNNNMVGVVHGENISVRIGSELVNVQPIVESKAHLKNGSVVALMPDAKKVYAADGGWLPIKPILDEVRYIPASAVKSAPQVQRVQSSPAATPAATAAAPGSDDEMWNQGLQAEREGRTADAADIYIRLAHRSTDHQLQIRCYNRIHFLRNNIQASTPYGYQPGHPTEARYPDPGRLTPTAPPPPGYPGAYAPMPPAGQTPYQTTSRQTVYPQPVASAQPAVSGLQKTIPGYLRRTTFLLDNRVAYVLEASNGTPRIYITAQAGLSLDPFVGRNVELWGAMVYHGGMRTYYMNASAIRQLQ